MKSSIRTQIMTAFIVILTLTMVLCIGLNNGLLKDFYYQKKQEKVVHYYEKLDQLTNNKSENDSKVSAVLISMRDADNISFIQTTSDWSLDEVSANCVSNMQASELRHRLMQYILVWDRMDTVTTLKQAERYKILKYYDPVEGTSYMDCYGSLSNGTFFLMSTPLEAVQDVSEAIVNYVALLGWSPADNNEIFSLKELVEKFDYHHINKSPAVFDINKLRWMNGEYIKKMDPEVFYERALPYMKEVLKGDFNFKKIAGMVQTRIETFPDIPALIDFFQEVPEYDASMYCHKKMKTNEETSLTVLKEVLPLLEAQEDYTNDPLFASLSEFVKEKGYKNGYVMWPLRTAVSGKQMTPAGATEIMEIIGKDETIRRVKAAIEKLENL